ncbi:hypothetical protein [Actinophytocola gossypii]|uniref:DUF3039 domain-containing protein n=1 Tax=Actinophytocola gossypii TaxID=2812003 RepID=A0ABT2JBI6_9PSEU|nr:hypothetical protein [Actinophytocola gossypii]MCT2585239.1 hypothetical protein [Actinophytocola gossypii]
MLYIVLALVLAAFGLLIAALTTANTVWAWISVTISVVAAALLIADWVGTRRRAGSMTAPASAAPPRAPTAPEEPRDPVRDFEQVHERGPEPEPIPLVEQTVQHERFPALPPPDEEPGEEATDASDLLVVSELTIEVRVVDEHPRYHLGSCAWLKDKATLPLPVNEARQLGFTPCAYCGPDAVLAARHRAAR